MKVNYTMFDTHLTGGVRGLLEIANGLVDRGHEVTITSRGRPNDHKWFPLKANINYVPESSFKRFIGFGLDRFLKFDVNINDAIKQLYEFTPDCEINVATYCFTAYYVYRSEK